MKKVVMLALAIGFFANACLPAPATDIPVATVDLDATAAVLAQQTLAAMPSFTAVPSNTAVVVIASSTNTPSPTSTATLETGTLTSGTVTTSTGAMTVTATPTGSTATVISNANASATQTLHPRFYGTLPPNLPYSGIELLNKSKAEAYISLQATTIDGYTTILEYPVGGLFSIQAPVGKYKYVAWVGGNKINGSFVLGRTNDVRITIYKDRIEVRVR